MSKVNFELPLGRVDLWPRPVRHLVYALNGQDTIHDINVAFKERNINASMHVNMIGAKITHINLTFDDDSEYTAFLLKWS